MRVGLHDAEYERMPDKDFPNYALMKISAYHKNIGDKVEWWSAIDNNKYDIVYSSKVFDFTPENEFLPECTIKGGTGYGIYEELPPEIDKMFPDYSIYPNCDYAIGFITRGCIRNCPWCVVPKKEGKIKPYKKWKELVREDTNKLVLMDNNILACEYGIEQLKDIAKNGSNYLIDCNQGLDARLVTDDVAQILAKINWLKYIRFSCDQKSQIESIKNACNLLKKYGVGYSKIFIYAIVRKDLQEADERIQALYKYQKSLNIYAQAERNELLGIKPDKLQLEFAQRYVYGRLYKKETWAEYYKRHKELR